LLPFPTRARLFDRVFHRRASAYGWVFYFGDTWGPIDLAAASNVCVGCGAGHPVAWLLAKKAVRRKLLPFRSYRCPAAAHSTFSHRTIKKRTIKKRSGRFLPVQPSIHFRVPQHPLHVHARFVEGDAFDKFGGSWKVLRPLGKREHWMLIFRT
jgi:hypothetical protein